MPEVAILVKAKDEASRTFKTVAGSLEGLAEAGKAAIIPMAGLAAAGTALIAKTTLTAARTEELGVVIENLGRVSGYSEEQLAETEAAIKKLGITTQGARTIMSRFMGAQLDLADASKIARAAQDLAVIGMKDSSEAAQDLTYAIASMQPRILRQYGIFVNLNDVYKETAERLDTTVEALTASEKRQGMLNAVLEKAGSFTGTYEAAMTTAGKQMRSFRRYTEEMANALGEEFLPYLEEGIGLATDFAKAFLALDDEQKKGIARTIAYGTAMSGAVAAASALLILLPKIKMALVALYGPGGVFLLAVGIMAALAVATVEAQMEYKALREELLETAETAEDYVAAMQEVRGEAIQGTAATRNLVDESRKLAEEKIAEADAWDYTMTKMEPVMKAQMEEAKLIADMTHETQYWSQEVVTASGEVELAIKLASASAVLDIGETAEAYRELRDKQIEYTGEAAEAARIAREEDLTAMRDAAAERIVLFSLEMLEHKDALAIPIEGYEDMEVSAQEFYDLAKAGIIPLSDEMITEIGGAQADITDNWDVYGDRSAYNWGRVLEDARIAFDYIILRQDELAARPAIPIGAFQQERPGAARGQFAAIEGLAAPTTINVYGMPAAGDAIRDAVESESGIAIAP